jgi:subtilase family serine protease
MRRFYSADNINFNGVPGDGRGMTIAIVDAFHYATAPSDLQGFDSYYGLPDPPVFQILNQTGQASNYPNSDAVGGWGIEAALDIEWAHAMAPLANITLVEANSAFTSDLFQAAVTAANLSNTVVVSMSFGTPEVSYEASTWDSDFLTPAGHGGVTFLAATGDHGTPGTYPAFSPNVVAVGGTAITYQTDGSYASEIAWSGTGGGTSTVESRPSYQTGIQSSGFRTIPDVSMDAQPSSGVAVYDTYDHGASTPWAKYGGTSLATPMFAALVAIADQGRISIGQTRLDGRTQLLPALYSLSTSNSFHDVIGGTSNNGATAVGGYDLATGIGTPIANVLVNNLAGVGSVTSQFTGSAPGDNFILTLDTSHL